VHWYNVVRMAQLRLKMIFHSTSCLSARHGVRQNKLMYKISVYKVLPVVALAVLRGWFGSTENAGPEKGRTKKRAGGN